MRGSQRLCPGLSGSIALLALGMATAAQAQGRAERPGAADEGDVIVVTAQRRAENLQDVPISITALTGEAMEASGVQDTRDLPLLTPGLRIDSIGAYVQPAIRGITTTLTTGPEPNVATYLDGVYRPDTNGAVYDLPDVQQIEVLKGPQGTLFGRNATGGAILITTRKPDLREVVGEVSAGYGSFRTFTTEGFVSVPVAEDRVALSLSAFFEDMSRGWKRNVADGRKDGAAIESGLVRGKLRFVPWEGADFTLTGLYTWRNDHSAYRSSIWHGNHDLAGAPGVLIPSKPWTYSSDWDPNMRTRGHDVSLRGEIEVGPGTLTSTTAYSKTRAKLLFDTDNVRNGGTYATTDTDYRSFTQELVYATEQLGRVRGVAGLFFFDSRFRNSPYFVKANGFQLWLRDTGRSYAGFGELTYDLSDRLSVTGGVRYSHEERTGAAATALGQPPLVRPALNELGKKSWNALTPRLSLLYKAGEDTNFYATYSRGFKSGLFNTPGFQTRPVDPEKVDAYEIGIKSQPVAGLRLSAAAFHYDYRDLQVPTIELVGNVLTQRILNAATAKIRGGEANADWEVTPEFRLIAGLSFIDAEYASFQGASVNVPVAQLPAPGNALCTETVKPTSGLCNVVIDASGNAMIRTPKWSGSLTANYRREFDPGTLSLSATAYLSSEVFYEYGNRIRQPGFAKLNASASWAFPGGLELGVWGRNLTNERVITSVVSTSSYDAVDYERPREFGATVKYRF